MKNEIELNFHKDHLQRLAQHEYVLNRRLEAFYKELSSLMHSIKMAENSLDVCQRNQVDVSRKIHALENENIGLPQL
jgi:chromosome segregation ATPase